MAQTPSVDFFAMLNNNRAKRAADAATTEQVLVKLEKPAKLARVGRPAKPAKVKPIVRKNGHCAPTPTVMAHEISAAEFLRRCNQTTDQMKHRELIRLYVGTYDLLEPFGVQFDNARIRAREEWRNSVTPDSNVVAIPRPASYPGYVTEALASGRDAQRRLALLSADDSGEVTVAVRSALESQIQSSAAVLEVYLHNQSLN